MKLRHTLIALAISAPLLGGCAWFSDFVYKPDIAQGNYIEQKQVSKLRKGMTKEQVKFVIGTPMVVESFDDATWYYVYRLKSGKTGEITRSQLVLHFDQQELLATIEGDFDKHEEFATPLDQ